LNHLHTRQILVSEFVTRAEEDHNSFRRTSDGDPPQIPNNYKYSYRKIGPRKALSLSKVSFVGISLPDAGEIRLAYGSVGPTVIRAFEAEQLFYKGKISDIPDSIEQTVRPISDQRSTAEYRRYLCRALTEDFLRII
jgi:CO/xanthine dehydrogenase FAD-binding subunit